MTFGLGDKNDHYFKITISSDEGESLSRKVPYYDYDFQMPSSLSLSGSSTTSSFIYIDNLVMTTTQQE